MNKDMAFDTAKQIFSVCGAFLVVAALILSAGCSGDKAVTDPEESRFEFQIANKSQFTIHHVYLHAPDRNYKETEPLLDNWLEENSHISLRIDEGDYLVTVTRMKNETGPLLAYTTIDPLYLYEPVKLDYFDDYFRLGEIETPELPEGDSRVVSDSNEISGCFVAYLTQRNRDKLSKK